MPLQPTIPPGDQRNKAKFIFKGPTKTWSEVHWTGQTGTGGLQTSLTQAVALAQLRCNLLAAGNRMIRVEVSCPLVKRNTLRDSSCQNFIAPFVQENTAQSSLRVFVTAGTLNRASIFLGGIPDSQISGDQWTPPAGSDFPNALNQYMSTLIGNGWGLMGRNKVQGTAPRVRITQVGNVAGALNTITVTTQIPHLIPVQPYTYARVGGVVGATPSFPVNQLWQVITVDGTHFTLIGFPIQTSVTVLQGSGFARYAINAFQAYTDWVNPVATRHKRGTRTEEVPAKKKFKRTIGY